VAVDPASNQIVRTLDGPAEAGPLILATIAGDKLWAMACLPVGCDEPEERTGSRRLVRFDLVSGEAKYYSDLFACPQLTAAYGSLWVTDCTRRNLLRIDIED
jgi:hypothetical protein